MSQVPILPHAHGSREYLAVKKSAVLLTLDGESHTLKAGDSIYYDGDCMHGYRNPSRVPCVFYLAMDVSGEDAGTHHRPAPPDTESVSEMESSRREVDSASSKVPHGHKVIKHSFPVHR
jgi:hypothetical protein